MKIVIVGGGFGGVKAALELAKHKKNRITLISDRDDLQYYPALYSTATGGSHMQSWIPLNHIFGDIDNVHIIVDPVVSLDKKSKTISTKSGAVHKYGALVLALGSVTTYFGIPGLDDYAYGIKSQDEIDRLKQHLLHDFSRPHAADSQFLVIGAGPTGVELAASLGAYLRHLKKKFGQPGPRMRINLIEAAPRVLPRMSEKTSQAVHERLEKLGVHVEVGKKVEESTADSLIVSGVPIKSQTVIWTSGVATNPFYKDNDTQFEFTPNGKIVVDKHLRSSPGVYVIGDNAGTPNSGLAQVAIHDGHYVAKHIMKKTKRAYKSRKPGVVVPVGERWAAFEYGNIHLIGWTGALIRQAADLVGYRDILPLGKALRTWISQSDRSNDVYYPELDTPLD